MTRLNAGCGRDAEMTTRTLARGSIPQPGLLSVTIFLHRKVTIFKHIPFLPLSYGDKSTCSSCGDVFCWGVRRRGDHADHDDADDSDIPVGERHERAFNVTSGSLGP
jgi:hypothetical protein